MTDLISSLRQNEIKEWEVQELVYDWFRKITDKAPVDEMLAMLCRDGFEMQFPEATLHNPAEFKQWYETVTHTFFDQVHDVKMLSVEKQDGHAEVVLIVNWQARTWQAPAATSEWQGSYVHQRWQVIRDPHSGKPVISVYAVGTFDAMKPA